MSRAARASRLALALGAALAIAAAPAAAQKLALGVRASATVRPAEGGRLGDPLVYRVTVHSDSPVKVRFLPPVSGGAFHWGEARTWRGYPNSQRPRMAPAGAWIDADSYAPAVIEIPLQVFALGQAAVPGLALEVDDGRGPRRHRAPVARVLIVPGIAANDSTADLRAARGPLAAPWWERVPWTQVAIAAAIAAVIGFLLVRWLRRRPAPVAAPAPPPRPVDPAAVALRELAALRRRGLPARGEFAEHAFHLTRIARRFVEATAGRVRPGDTTPEFVEHLAATPLSPGEVTRLEGLLRYWDRVKFARAGTTADEAAAAEDSVERLVQIRTPQPGGKAA